MFLIRLSAGAKLGHASPHAPLDLRNLLTASELIIRSALLREDSRGAHFREDFPNTDNINWLVNIYCRNKADTAELWTEKVKLTRLKP